MIVKLVDSEKSKSESQDEIASKTLQLSFQKLIFNEKQCNVLTIRDMSDVEKYAEVEAENKILSLLTTSVTHEMLTPLKCVVQFGTTLLKSSDPSVVKEAQLIVSTAKLLLSEVKLILDKNMLDNNAFTPNFEQYPLKKTILDVIQILEPQAALLNIKFNVSLPRDEVTVLLDQLRPQQVMINLLSNAIKFSKPPGKVDITVTTNKVVTPNAQDDIEIHITVRDHGIGISAQDQKNLFQPYFKTTDDLSRVKNMGSHGMGLNISFRCVKGMNGQVSVQSKLGEGSSFTITLLSKVYSREGERKKVSQLLFANNNAGSRT